MSSNKHEKDLPKGEESNEFFVNSIAIISHDNSLRNLYHLGFNTKTMTKAMSNSFKFEDSISLITHYINTDQLPIKLCGPLILGLARLHNKKMLNLLEDIQSIFKVKKNEPTEQKKGIFSKKQKMAEKIDNNNDQTQEDSSGQSSFGLMSLSPLNEGLYNILSLKGEIKEELSPMKMPLFFREPTSDGSGIEAFRAQQGSAGMLTGTGDKSNRDFSNFLQLGSEQQEPGQTTDDKRDNVDLNLNLDLNMDLDLNVEDNEHQTIDIERRLLFSDIKSKVDLGLGFEDLAAKPDTKPRRRIQFLDYDGDIEFDTARSLRNIDLIDIEAIQNQV